MEYSLKHIYITAPGIISSTGFSAEENMRHIRQYKPGIRLIEDQTLQNIPFMAARIDRERWKETAAIAGLEEYSDLEQLMILSLRETIRKSGIDPSGKDCCLIVSTTKGNIDYLASGVPDDEVFLAAFAGRVSGALGCVNKPIVISNACISGVSALIVARRLITAGKYKHILVAGGDLLTRFVVTGFESFKSIASGACRPFDESRDGLTLGEACGSVLLTSEAGMVSEKEPVVIEGGAITNDANHISGPSRTGDGLYYAISQAMDEAGVTTADVSFLNLHGTGTAYNDEMESKAVAWAGLDRLPLNSLKPYWGHTLGASGIIETIVCLEELQSGEVFGTPGYKDNGVSNQLNISPEHRMYLSKRCLKTASGFGGCNAAILLALQKYAKAPAVFTPAGYSVKRECRVINGEIRVDGQIAFQLPDTSFPEFIRAAYKYLSLDDRKFYKMDDLCKLGYMATAFLMGKDGLPDKYGGDEIALVFANKSASLDSDRQHQSNISAGDREASPAVFVYTLPNVVLGELCIRHKIKGENTFFIQDQYDEPFLRDYASLLMGGNKVKACITGWCELLGDQYEARLSWLEKIN